MCCCWLLHAVACSSAALAQGMLSCTGTRLPCMPCAALLRWPCCATVAAHVVSGHSGLQVAPRATAQHVLAGQARLVQLAMIRDEFEPLAVLDSLLPACMPTPDLLLPPAGAGLLCVPVAEGRQPHGQQEGAGGVLCAVCHHAQRRDAELRVGAKEGAHAKLPV
jgi:hypothetical protein